MPLTDELQYPVLEVAINGAVVERRPVCFSLQTEQGLPSVLSYLLYPAGVENGAAGDTIEINLVSCEERARYFTGVILDAHTHGANKKLSLSDGYKKLFDASFTPAYRKEKAKVILDDILEAAGIENKKITCPDIELARFSLDTLSAQRCVELLLNALFNHGVTGIRYFFDAENTFRFGSIADSGKNEGNTPAFETKKNIISKGRGWIETLPVPLRHSQAVTIDGAAFFTYRTELLVSQTKSRIRFWVRGE
jgi:hypothetical protein